jgi:chemotaxis protein histidine kinase CheA
MSEEDLDIVKELIDEFLDEADKLHYETANCAAAVMSEPGDEFILEALEDCFHTIKQRVGFLDFTALIDLTGAFETMLIQQRATGTPLQPEQLALIDQGLAELESGFSMLRQYDMTSLDVTDIVSQVHATTQALTAAPNGADDTPPEALAAAAIPEGEDEPLSEDLSDEDEDEPQAQEQIITGPADSQPAGELQSTPTPKTADGATTN